MKQIALVGILAILLASVVSASTSCPCSRPGAAGLIVGFVARNGTTDDVNFYTEVFPPISGERMDIWATKAIDDSIVPIENLFIRVEIDGVLVEELVTDDNGYFILTPDEPGSYVLYGGDTEMLFDIKGEEELPVACTLDAKICPDGSYVSRVGPDCEFEECPDPVPTLYDEPADTSADEPVPQEDNIRGAFNPLDPVPFSIIVAVLAIIAIVIVKKK